MTGLRVGVDTGGTFTDAVVADGKGGWRVHKLPSTPRKPERAILAAATALAPPPNPSGRGSAGNLELVLGTTLATNALLTGKLGRVALVTTRGFADLLAIGRQARDRLYCLEPRLIRPAQPRSRVVEAEERLDAQGRVVTRLTAEECERIARKVAAMRPQAVAVAFLHSFRNPVHEIRLGRALRKLGVPVALSSEVAPEIREYERAATAWADASLAPVVGPALLSLDVSLKDGWGKGSQLKVMRSDGGTAGAREAALRPVHLAVSGPAGGLAAARTLARARGDREILTLDMGGTSTDVALVGTGEPVLAPVEVGGLPLLSRGLPLHSVGTGGGSLAGRDLGGALTVGPESAGARPGPACYGRGGERPTLTDAHLVCGRLHPDAFLGGKFPLDPGAARRVVAKLGQSDGWNPEETACAMLEVALADMERALRRVSLAEGHDPRERILYAFGGAGGLHAAALAGRMGMGRVVIPPHPGAFSALGLLASPPRRTLARSVLEPLPSARRRGELFGPLVDQARRELRREGVPASRILVRRTVELRGEGQAGEFPLAEGPRLLERFHREHARRFGYAREDRPVHLVAVRVQADGPSTSPWRKIRVRRNEPTPFDHREAWMPEGGGKVEARWHFREDLSPGAVLNGPACVAEYSATTVVPSGWTATLDGWGCLVLEECA